MIFLLFKALTMDFESSNFSDDDDDIAPPIKRGLEGGTSNALDAFKADLGLHDLPRDFIAGGKESMTRDQRATEVQKKKRRRAKEKRLPQDPFAVVGDTGGSLRPLSTRDDSAWIAKMGLGAPKVSNRTWTPPETVVFHSSRKSSTVASSRTKVESIVNQDDVGDIDMDRTRLEIMKYELESGADLGKKKRAAKTKLYLQKLGAREPKVSKYRNPEDKRNYEKNKRKAEEKERRVRKEMGLKVDNHEERRKKMKINGGKKRSDFKLGTVGKWNEKTGTLKV